MDERGAEIANLWESSTIWGILTRVNVLPQLPLAKVRFYGEILSTSASKVERFTFS